MDEFHRRKVNIYKVKVRYASDLRATVKKESTRNRRLRINVEKEVAEAHLGKVGRCIYNPSAERTVAAT